jgi:hypothetical protein
MGDRENDDIGAHAGWGSAEDLKARPGADANAPVTRDRFVLAKYYRGPGNALMLVYLPASGIVLYIELSAGVPPVAAWLSLIGVAAMFLVIAVWLNARHPR